MNLEMSLFPNSYSDFIKQLSLDFASISWTLVETENHLAPFQGKLSSKWLETILLERLSLRGTSNIYNFEVPFPEINGKSLFKCLSHLYQVTSINYPK